MSSQPFTIAGADHTGITVSSIQDALKFWHDLLGLPIKWHYNDLSFGPEPNIVGVANAKVNVALLALPNGHNVELLEYTAPEDRTQMKPRSCDVGSVHLALKVKGTAALVREAEKLGWKATVSPPVRIRRGDGSAGSFCYIRGPDGVTVELIEEVEGEE